MAAAPGAPLGASDFSKPVRVWCSSTSLRVAWYQAAPFSDQVTIFYKKTGSLFGTEVSLSTASLKGPELSIRQPASANGEAVEYFELELRKLRPNTQYVVKVRGAQPGNSSQSLRSDRMSTLSQQEEAQRNADMANFIGSLVKLGEFDGTVIHFDDSTGLYLVRVLQADDSTPPQLVRLESDYSELGLPAKAYTLSSLRFGRWGGEISDSRVVAEGELRWVVSRHIAMSERSDASDAFSVKEGMLRAQAERLEAQVESQQQVAQASLTLTRRTYLMLCGVIVLACVALACVAVAAAWHAQSGAAARASGAEAEAARLRLELRRLELYRVSLELGMGAWLGGSAAAASTVGRGRGTERSRQNSNNSQKFPTSGPAVCPWDPAHCELIGWGTVGMNLSVEDPSHSRYVNISSAHVLLSSDGPLRQALLHSQRVGAGPGRNQTHTGETEEVQPKTCSPGDSTPNCTDPSTPQPDQPHAAPVSDSDHGGGGGAGDSGAANSGPWSSLFLQEGEAGPIFKARDLEEAPPHPWTFVQHAASLYSTYLTEWLKLHMAQSIRERVHDILEADQSNPWATGTPPPFNPPKSAAEDSTPGPPLQGRRRQAAAGQGRRRGTGEGGEGGRRSRGGGTGGGKAEGSKRSRMGGRVQQQGGLQGARAPSASPAVGKDGEQVAAGWQGLKSGSARRRARRTVAADYESYYDDSQAH